MHTWVKCTTLQEDKGQRAISTADHGVPFPADGWRFAGATFDPTALYRLSAVLEWLAAESIDAALVHAHAVALQTQFMAAMADHSVGPFVAERLVVPLSEPARGNFLTFEHPQRLCNGTNVCAQPDRD
jgi:kynureninase